MNIVLADNEVRDISLPRARPKEAPAPPAPSIPIPRARPRYNSNYFYFVTSPDNPAPILDNVRGMSQLPGDTLIRFKVLPNTVDGATNLVSFETVPTHIDEPVIRGKIPYNFLGEQLGQRPTIENLQRYEAAMKIYTERERRERIKKEAEMSIEDVLKEFHQTYCANNGPARSEDALKAKWDSFIKNAMLSPRGKQMAENAKAWDLVSRTVLYEAQRQSQMGAGAHPRGEACQWDIIALSIKNRAFSDKVSRYGGNFRGDVVGVATDSQYNVWMQSKVRQNPNLLGCFLHSNYASQRGGKARQDLFKGITAQIKDTLIAKEDQPMSNHDLSSRFEVTNPQASPAPQMTDMTHYYHPGGMGSCNVEQRTAPTIQSGIIKIDPRPGQDMSEYRMFIPVVNGSVLGLKDIRVVRTSHRMEVTYMDFTPSYEWKIDVFKKKDGKWVQVTSEEAFGAQAYLVETKSLDERYTVDHYACLPRGVMPQCFQGSGLNANQLATQGIRVPYTWFNKPLRESMEDSLKKLGFSNAEHNFELPDRLASASPAGVPIGLRCKSPGMGDNSRPDSARYPQFGGDCDTNIVLASGVDQVMPRIANIPLPVRRPDIESVEQ